MEVAAIRRRKAILSLATVVAVVIIIRSAGEAAVVVEDFPQPDPMSSIAMMLVNPDATAVQTGDLPPAAVGGERDILLGVMDVSRAVRLSGTVDGGSFVFNSSVPGVAVILQHEGTDGDAVGPAAAFVNSEGLGGADLTRPGGAPFLNSATIEVARGQATDIGTGIDGGGGAAAFVGQISESAAPLMFVAPIGVFSNPGELQQTTSVEAGTESRGSSDVGFRLNAFRASGPAVVSLLGLGLLAAIGLHKRR